MGRCKLTERELDYAMEYGPKTDRVSEVAKFETSESLSRCHLPASCTRLFQQSLHAFKMAGAEKSKNFADLLHFMGHLAE